MSYNLGWRYNFKFYFGDNPLQWFLPMGRPKGDGYHWDKQIIIKPSQTAAEEGLSLVIL